MAEDKLKIIIADDTTSIRKVLNLFLSRFGYDVIEAENGREVLGIVEKTPVDLLILDISMPVMNGLETLKKIREFDAILPVIMVTANDSKENIRTALHSGASAFISKPIKFDELERLISEGLRKREVAMLKQKISDSARLIAVGEMAGQVAHEVLNPMTAVITRIEEMSHKIPQPGESGLVLVKEIIKTWERHYKKSELPAYLNKPSGFTEGITCAQEDFNDLLTIINDYISQEETYRANMVFLEKSIFRVIKIVDSLRRLSRHRGNPTPINVNQVINESLEIVLDILKKRNIEFVRDFDPQVPDVMADFDEIIQVITNLTNNSIHAMSKTRRPGVIEFQTSYASEHVEIRITDNGSGIPKELQSRNFDKTFTTKNPSEGTGLGLGISRRIIRKYNGELELEWSEVGKGTCFIIRMPPCADKENE